MDLFELVGKIRLDGAEGAVKQLQGVSNEGKSASQKLSGVMSKVGGAAVAAGKVAVAGLGVAAGGIGAVLKGSIDSYASYEQLTGGVEKIFGDAAGFIERKAAGAFKSAGMSANDYMENVTGFSAALVQSMGGNTQAAAELADQAIIDMSDNANVYGSNITDIQNAYQGFAKGNYTMLDNLKLGYGGTNEEMIRLINDSGVLNETIESMDGIGFDTIIEAIHAVQTDLSITGTTAKEAAGTIEGSMAMTKAAWANTLTAIAQGSEVVLGENLADLTASVGLVVDNLAPRIKIIFDAIPQVISELAPQIPVLLQSLLPGLVQGAVQLIISLAEQLPAMLVIIKDALVAGVYTFIDAIAEHSPKMAGQLQVVFDTIKDAVRAVVDFFKEHFEDIKTVVTTVFDAIKTAVTFVIDNLDKLAIAVGIAATAFGAFKLLAFIGEAGSLSAALMKVVTSLTASTTAKIADKAETIALQALYAKDAVLMAASTVKTIALTAAQKAAAVAQKALNLVMNANPMGIIITVIAALVAAFITLWNTNEGFRNAVIEIWNAIKEAALVVFAVIGDFISSTWESIKNVTSTVWNAIKSAISTVINAIKSAITTVWNGIKSVTSSVWNGIKSTVDTVWNGIKSGVSNAVNAVKSTVSNVWNGIKSTTASVWEGIKSAITKPIDAAKDFVKGVIDKIKGFFNFHVELPHIALPHFAIRPSGWQLGDLLKGSIPSLGIDWYANGGVFDSPTIMPSVRGMIGVGEAGPEAVAPIDVLKGYVSEAVKVETGGINDALGRIVTMLEAYMPQMLEAQDKTIMMDTGALVGAIASPLDARFGRMAAMHGRGN